MTLVESATPDAGSVAQVTVLLSTYNGSEFLQAQLDSLYAQTHTQFHILVRDDGSSDDTRSILEREQAKGRLEFLAGHDNLGAGKSYLELLRQAATRTTDFVAFCDQDDVWRPDKLERAVAALSDAQLAHGTRIAMYCSQLEIVDRDLAPIDTTPAPRKSGMGNALLENIAVGCTIMLNRPAIELLANHLPEKVLVHDWWCYLTVSCFGDIVFDQQAPIKYRQHACNAFGVARGHMDRFSRTLRRLAGTATWQSEQAKVFLATFDSLIAFPHKRILTRFVNAKSSWWSRLQLAMSSDIWRQRRLDSIAARFLILINRY